METKKWRYNFIRSIEKRQKQYNILYIGRLYEELGLLAKAKYYYKTSC
jgi:hypothetical protein